MKVLVIDDEAPIRLLCRVNLEAEGIEVAEAGDGEQGLELARSESPDAILLDVMLPGLHGWAVAERLLEDEKTSGIPVIFLTARADLRDRARGMDLGGVDYVTKPFNPVELAPLVRDVVAAVERATARRSGGEARRASCALRQALEASSGSGRRSCGRTTSPPSGPWRRRRPSCGRCGRAGPSGAPSCSATSARWSSASRCGR